nr:MAG TPA: hypothetical protein [Bacteriophage sp.]
MIACLPSNKRRLSVISNKQLSEINHVWFKSTPHQLQQTSLTKRKALPLCLFVVLPIKRRMYHRHT